MKILSCKTFCTMKLYSILYTLVLLLHSTMQNLDTQQKQSVSHLVCSVDGGPCLEEYPHHTGVTFVGCYYQRSIPILWGKVERATNTMQSKACRARHYGCPILLCYLCLRLLVDKILLCCVHGSLTPAFVAIWLMGQTSRCCSKHFTDGTTTTQYIHTHIIMKAGKGLGMTWRWQLVMILNKNLF